MHPPSRKCSGSPSSGKTKHSLCWLITEKQLWCNSRSCSVGGFGSQKHNPPHGGRLLEYPHRLEARREACRCSSRWQRNGTFSPRLSRVTDAWRQTWLHLGALGWICGRNRLPAGSSNCSECAVKNKTIAISGHSITLRACKYVRTCSGLLSMFQ